MTKKDGVWRGGFSTKIKRYVEENAGRSVTKRGQPLYDNENSYTSQMVRTIKYFAELDKNLDDWSKNDNMQ